MCKEHCFTQCAKLTTKYNKDYYFKIEIHARLQSLWKMLKYKHVPNDVVVMVVGIVVIRTDSRVTDRVFDTTSQLLRGRGAERIFPHSSRGSL